MKRIFCFAFSVVCILGCGKFDRSTFDKGIVFRATIKNGLTKTSVNTDSSSVENRGKVSWDSGDEIVVYSSDKSVSVRYGVSEILNDGSAVFEREPLQEGNLGSGPYTASFGDTLSAVQTFSSSVKDLPMSGASDESDWAKLDFSVSCGLLRVILKDENSLISRIELSGIPTGGNRITYTLNCSEPVDVSSFKTFILRLPDGTYDEFVFVDKEGFATVKASDQGIEVLDGKISSIRFSNLAEFDLLPGKFSVGDGKKVRFSKEDYPSQLDFSGANSVSGGRLLSNEQWKYLLETRDGASGKYRNNVTVSGTQHCLLIAPDDFEGNLESQYTKEEANNKGLVCLAPSGYLSGKSSIRKGEYGYYLSSSSQSDDRGYCLIFNSSYVNSSSNILKSYCASIRLVSYVR